MLAAGTMFWGDTFLDSVLANGVPSDEELRSISSFLCAHDCLQFDTAEGYGFGSSESRLSKAVRNNNDNSKEVRIWTKFMPTVWRWTRESFFSSLHNSLDRLNQIKPAIYFIHTPVHPMFLSWVQWAFEAKREGLIKGVGLSNCGAVEVEAALEIAKGFGDKIEANQIMFSLLDFACPHVQQVVNLCQKNDIKIIAYNILGQGLLTDRLNRENYGTFRASKMLRGLSFDRLSPLRKVISDIAREHTTTMAAVCINWTIRHGCIALVGMRTLAQAKEAVAAMEDFRLTDEQLLRLDNAALDISTLEKPKWKRLLFVFLISLLLIMYMLTRCISYRKTIKK